MVSKLTKRNRISSFFPLTSYIEEFLPSYIFPLTSDIISMFDLNKIQSALQSLKEERAHIEEYLQMAAEKKK